MRVGVVERAVERETIRLDLVSSRDAKGFIVRLDPGKPAYKGPGPANYACGKCGAVLCEGVRAGILGAVIFQCSCGEFNQMKKAAPKPGAGG